MEKRTWIIIIIAIVIIGILFGISMSKNEKQNIQEPNTTNNSVVQNKVVNTEVLNNVNEIEENQIQNEVNQNVVNEVSTETFEGEAKTEEEKAISIAKKDYGTNSNVKFSVEGMDEKGRHVVVVRNIETTEALAFYFVNVTDGTFDKKEMN